MHSKSHNMGNIEPIQSKVFPFNIKAMAYECINLNLLLL